MKKHKKYGVGINFRDVMAGYDRDGKEVKPMSKREEFKQELRSWTYLNTHEMKLSLRCYDRGHADVLSEGEELRTELVEALELLMNRGDIRMSRTQVLAYKALIAKAEGVDK